MTQPLHVPQVFFLLTPAHGTKVHETGGPWQHSSHQKTGNNQVHQLEKDEINSAEVLLLVQPWAATVLGESQPRGQSSG